MINWQWLRFEELSTQQLYQMIALREAVFVVEQDCPYQDVDGRDPQALHLLGSEDGQLLAYARVFPPEPLDSSIGRVVTAKAARGRGLGQQLMRHAINYCQQHWPAATIHISAQRYLEDFYQSLGFDICTKPYLEDNIPHVGMEIKAND
ncbi:MULTISPECIES: GNAT family N-acetyltransferase [unclassified Agarivorans]|uniref:GNAT family N-acetyltransferase n=1 Tax=Agarivorans sp. 1_MG-2023 TaxID=3062634 RepID=UPI0010D92C11|nr:MULTISPECIES: GNAT family N-acetyltransferase [unclassified Agarivorans]MDO6764423.1 GNAT family N-acetyltransferase [Agarivorans sp. 1_MG-2023]GDY27368.1 acetyltransferase [Agarivorans sp. Toyoura001]